MSVSSCFHMHFIFLALVIFQTFTFVSAFSGDGNKTDHETLLHIKSLITHDPYGVLESWNSSLYFCNWSGVTCGKRHKRVTLLVLQSKGLEGSLSPRVGNLTFLRVLVFANNSIHGVIPPEVGRLSRLRIFSLAGNKFNGVIPTNISACSNLEVLALYHNKLVGSIPKEISFLSKLTILDLEENNLRGGIPPSLGNITSMKVLAITENPLGGSIPHTLGHWKHLTEFDGGSCNLSGTIPHSLYNLSLLSIFSLSNNQLTGSFPPTKGEMLPQIVFLQLHGNQLTGPLPPFISNCSKLEHLEMTYNNFTGKVAIDFTKLRSINVLLFGNNNLRSNDDDEMMFIDSLKNCTRLEVLSLRNCSFQGMLPTSIGNLSNRLHTLNLERNQLHGKLPRSIGNLVGLKAMALGGNKLTGYIPSTIGNLQKLQVLNLGQNQLSGTIPDTIGNLSMLLKLYLFSNKLEGVIPSSLGNCNILLELSLSDNQLTGKIPTQILQLSTLSNHLDLSQNNLVGVLPIEVGELKMLNNLNLSENNLSGNIPSSLGGCASLLTLSLEGNFFEGTIQPSLLSLKGLLLLDISRNNLSGNIPQFLQRLEYLNLSYNNFEGEVPMIGVLANATVFSILENPRVCGGVVELGLPKCKATKKHKKLFPLFIIIILIAFSLFTLACFAYAWCKKKKNMLSQLSTNEWLMKVSYGQLLKATDGFSEANLIGHGGFSSVYKGTLLEGGDTVVAIKVLHLQNRGAQRSFIRECEAWRNIRHRNLLKIITSCSSIDFHGNGFKALVYEFMPKGSLDDWLHASEGTYKLNYLQKISILVDVASALDYIHNQCIPTIVHGDLKPSNILLDDDMVAHVGDFGLARFLGTSYADSSTGIRGTIGYVPPEYGFGNEMTSSGDVYSFGILLLEMMTGKRPTDDIFSEGLSLHTFSSMALPNHVTDVIDLNIVSVYQEDENFMQNVEENVTKIEECLALTVKIGVSCTMDSPPERIDIKKVLHELQHILNALQNI